MAPENDTKRCGCNCESRCRCHCLLSFSLRFFCFCGSSFRYFFVTNRFVVSFVVAFSITSVDPFVVFFGDLFSVCFVVAFGFPPVDSIVVLLLLSPLLFLLALP